MIGTGYMEQYGKLLCEECGKHYFIYLGDMTDQTIGDVEMGVCPYCKNRQILPGVEISDLYLARIQPGIKELKP